VEGRCVGGRVAGRRKPRGLGRPRERGNGLDPEEKGERGAELGLLAAREREGRGSLGHRARKGGGVLFCFFFYFPFFYSKAIFKTILKITLNYF